MLIKRGNKAQIYIIAAVIIILAIIGVAGVTNYMIIKDEPEKFFDLGETLNREGSIVIQRGYYSGSEEQIPAKMSEFTNLFTEYIKDKGKEEEFDMITIYGDQEKVNVTIYSTKDRGEFTVFIGDSPINIETAEEIDITEIENIVPDPTTGQITIKVDGTESIFDLEQGQNFLFLITTSKDFETYVSTNLGEEA